MTKHAFAVKLPIISTGALVGCIAEILQLPILVTGTLVIASQLVLTSLWIIFRS
jgi:hypothetical protein